MSFIWNTITLVGALNSLLAFLIVAACWPFRQIPVTRPLIALMCSVGFWALFGTLEIGATNMGSKIFWNTLMYAPLLASPVIYLIFAMSYTGRVDWLGPRFYMLVGAIPSLVFIAAMTNSLHGLLWTSFTLTADNILLYGHGPFFWFGLVTYNYIMFAVGSLLLIRAAIQFPRGFRTQGFLVLSGSIIPFLGSLLYILGVTPLPGLDLTPLSLAGTGTLLGLGVLRLRLLDLVPIGRSTLVEQMSDGLLLFDQRQTLLDLNPEAQRLLGARLSVGSNASAFPAEWQPMVDKLNSTVPEDVSIELSSDQIYEARITPLPIPGRLGQAHLVLLRDITRLKQTEKALLEANERLHEQAVRDGLTGLYNRRFLMEALPREMARARRERIPVSVALMDIDHFKLFNDQHGHQAGDAMLQALGNFLRAHIRREDLAFRYGGEEFVLILAGADERQALIRAETLRQEFAGFGVPWKRQTLRATLSIGVSTYPVHADDENRLLQRADLALYAAKAQGRDRCIGASDSSVRATASMPVFGSY